MRRGEWVATPRGIGIVEYTCVQGSILVEIAYGKVESFRCTEIKPIMHDKYRRILGEHLFGQRQKRD